MLPQPNLEKTLFRLRWHVGFYDETGKDCFPQFLESLRPYLKVEERLKVALLKHHALSDLYMDGRIVSDEVLLRLARHPDFPVEDYDFAGSLAVVPGLLEEARKLPSEPERVGLFACSSEVHEGGQRRLVDFFAENQRPANALAL